MYVRFSLVLCCEGFLSPVFLTQRGEAQRIEAQRIECSKRPRKAGALSLIFISIQFTVSNFSSPCDSRSYS